MMCCPTPKMVWPALNTWKAGCSSVRHHTPASPLRVSMRHLVQLPSAAGGNRRVAQPGQANLGGTRLLLVPPAPSTWVVLTCSWCHLHSDTHTGMHKCAPWSCVCPSTTNSIQHLQWIQSQAFGCSSPAPAAVYSKRQLQSVAAFTWRPDCAGEDSLGCSGLSQAQQASGTILPCRDFLR